jgi:hypothetical protein
MSDLIGRFSFWVVFLFFAFMGVDALDLPATANLMSAILGFLPHVIAAILVGLLGILLANFSGEAVLIACSECPDSRGSVHGQHGAMGQSSFLPVPWC